MASYTLGTPVRMTASYALEGVPMDPGAVTWRVRTGGSEAVYTNATTPAVVRDDVGEYHLIIVPETEGTHFWRAEGTPPAEGAVEGNFLVGSAYFSG